MKGVPYETGTCVPFREGPPRDVAIAELSERQHGVVTLAQVAALGLTSSAVRKRVAAGRLHRIHRRVYAVGHRGLTQRGDGWRPYLHMARARRSRTGTPERCRGCVPTTGRRSMSPCPVPPLG